MNGLRQRVEIADGLIGSERALAHWFVRDAINVGSVTLKAVDLPRTRSYFYELTHYINLRNIANSSAPVKDYSFVRNGQLVAVLAHEFLVDDEPEPVNQDEVRRAWEFQTSNGLMTPTPDDEEMLDKLLKSSVGNPTLERRV